MKTQYLVVALAACLSLASCGGQPAIKPPVDEGRRVVIDERLLQECEQLADLKDNPQPSDVLEQHGADVLAYKKCATSKKDLIELVRKAFE